MIWATLGDIFSLGVLNEKYLLNGIRQKAREISNVFAGFSAPASFCKVKNMKSLTVDRRVKDFLTDNEIEQFLMAARKGLRGPRDFLLALLAYRHGFRVSELIDVRLEEVDLKTAWLFVRRLKGSLSTEHPLEGDELADPRLAPDRGESKFAHLPHLFVGERGVMTRQAVNYCRADREARPPGIQGPASYAPAFLRVLPCQ